MLTRQDIKRQATAASFSRGAAYHEEGAVGRIRRLGNQFSATVSGSEAYEVELRLTGAAVPAFSCTCPYDYEGICKHAVALGLAVLTAYGDGQRLAHDPVADAAAAEPEAARPPAPATLKGTSADPNPPAPEAPVSAAALEAALREATKGEKLAFLDEQLRQTPALARAFLTYLYGPPEAPDPLAADLALPSPQVLREEMLLVLRRLRFGPQELADEQGNALSANYPYRDFDEGQRRASLIIDEALRPAAQALRAAAEAGQLAEVLRRWEGAWLGIAGAGKPAVDPFWMFGGGRYAPLVLNRWLAVLDETGTLATLGRAAFAAGEVQRCLPALIKPLLAAQAQPRRRGPVRLPGLPGQSERLLLALAPNPGVAPALAVELRVHRLRPAPPLALRLAAGRADWAAWEQLASTLAVSDAGVAAELLQYYLERDDRAALLRAAQQHYTSHPVQLGPFVLRHLTPADDRRLYRRALEHRLTATQQFEDYLQLRELTTPKEQEALLKKVLKRPGMYGQYNALFFKPLFQAKVLAAEDRGREILVLALSLNWRPSAYSHSPNQDLEQLPDLLALAARSQPEATLDAVMERIETMLAVKSRRTTELYQHVGAWLQALHPLPGLTEQVRLFADELHRANSRITRLRDVLREAGLLPEPEPAPPKEPRGRRRKNPLR